MIILMVRSAKRVSNHEATDGAFILRDAASRLLRMRRRSILNGLS
jgi:hypothetical protein